MKTKLPDLVIGDIVINPPIVQGGMGVRISLSGLASAVSNEGALGTISCALIGGLKSHRSMQDYINADMVELAEQIKKARTMTKGPLAVNIMVALTNYYNLIKTAVEEGIDIIFSGAGLPSSLPEYVKGSRTKAVPIISSGRAADVMCRLWINKYKYVPDAIVLEGPLAGGHLGFSFAELESEESMPKVEKILVDVLEVARKYEKIHNKKIPVIVAGGVFDGNDIAKMLKIGAGGVQMATRFACTNECDADIKFKQAYIDCKKGDVMIIRSPVGMPGRAIRNEFLEKSKRGEIKFKCAWQCLKTCVPPKSPYCIADALLNAASGNINNGFVFIGSNAYRCEKIVSVKELINELVDGTEKALGLR
jgi:NAD(P)H-dependent flavin oxidoreductase YrpB (nitropropane dioxygenase family)